MPQRVHPLPRERLAAAADREPLPLSLAAREGRDGAMLAASRAVIGLFLRERTSQFTVKELAAHAGLSERTFYRYFPRKEDAIRPVIDAALADIVADMRAAPRGQSLGDAMVEAHRRSLAENSSMSWENLLPVLNETEILRAVWLSILTDAEVTLAHVVAERLGLTVDSPRARLAGAVLATAGRLALEQPFAAGKRRDSSEVIAEYLELLGPTLFEPPAGQHAPGRRSPPRRPRQRRG